MPTALALGLLLSTIGATSPTFTIVAPGFRVVQLDPALAVEFTDRLTQELARRGHPVTTREDITSLLGLERERQLLGCSEDERACLTELAGALGADAVITGGVARLGTTLQVSVKLLDAKSAAVLSSFVTTVADVDGVLPALVRTAETMARDLERLGRGARPMSAVVGTTAGSSPVRAWSWIPASVGAVAGGVAVWQGLAAASAHERLTVAGTVDPGSVDPLRLRQDGERAQAIAGASGIIAVLALGTSGAMWLFGGDATGGNVSFATDPDLRGASVLWTGVWP